MEIREFEFSQTGLSVLREHSMGQNWPVVYLINNKNELYVGETTSAGGRFYQHLNNPERKNLKKIRIATLLLIILKIMFMNHYGQMQID